MEFVNCDVAMNIITQMNKLKSLEISMQVGVKNPMQEELISRLEEENKVLVEEVEKMKKDQEELLELLAEEDSRILKLKMQLQSLGMQVSCAKITNHSMISKQNNT